MSRERFDILVIGAGVAGAAFAAGVRGRRVMLVERSAWPREKVCGCCLNSAAMDSLRRLVSGAEIEHASVSVDRVRVRARGREAYFSRSGGFAVSRSMLDSLLVNRAVDQGTRFCSGTAAHVLERESGGGWRVRVRDASGEREVVTDLVVAADGLTGGSLDGVEGFGVRVSERSWFGVGAVLSDRSVPAGVIEMNVGVRGYVGLVRLGEGRVNLAAALDPAWTKLVGGPSNAVGAILREAGRTAIDLDGAVLRGTGLLTRRRERVASAGLLVIGDAAGYVEPFTGEGMAWGLAGAEAASAFVNAGLGGEELASVWKQWHAGHVRSRQGTCLAVREVLRRPRLVGAAVALMGSVPAAARAAGAIARRIERPYRRVVATPGASA